MVFSADILDDLLKRVFASTLKRGNDIGAKRGQNRELRSVLLRLKNPRARLSHTEKKGKIFSALGELAWYLSGSNRSEFVTHYISRYQDEREADGTVYGAYGPRVFSPNGASQFDNVMLLLRERPSSRRAVIQLFDADDLRGNFKDVPCTCTLQFFVRSDRLHMAVSMRSNDAYFGLPHDVFAFTMIQEIAARTLGYEVGEYSHFAASLHIYEDCQGAARQYLTEGWQDSTVAAMPPMPLGDPWSNIRLFLEAEEAIRAGRGPERLLFTKLPDYWRDLVRVLQVYSLSKKESWEEIAAIQNELACPVYKEYVAQKSKHREPASPSQNPN